MPRLRLLALALLFAADSAGAQVLLNDNFNSVNGGNAALNFNAFPNWTVIAGTVDLVGAGNGIACAGGNGLCVDMDGSTSQSGRIGTQTFFFGAGETFNLSFDLSGNQRGGSDNFNLRLVFGTHTPLTNITGSGYLGGRPDGTLAPTFTYSFPTIAFDAPWITSTFSFTFVNAGQVSVEFLTFDNDNVGLVLDNVVITKSVPQNVVPEPSTYALMAAGLAAMGVVARRRRRA